MLLLESTTFFLFTQLLLSDTGHFQSVATLLGTPVKSNTTAQPLILIFTQMIMVNNEEFD